jgi:signal transduction histidine kinase
VLEVRTLEGRSLRVTDRLTPEGGLVKVIWDISDDVRREEDLQLARRAAEEGSAAKTEFLSSMSHELRTPLNAILGFAQLLQRDRRQPLGPRQELWVGHILQSGEHLLRLIDEVLDLARIESRRIMVSLDPLDVEDVIQTVATSIGPMAARAGIEVARATPAGPLPRVEADRTRFIQILTNFASNAVKYNNPGGRLEFAASPGRPGFVRVTVSDTGIGIPLDKQSKVFQPFHRAGQETGPIEGTGIGLAISKRLAEMMGGAIGFESTPGSGSAFWIELHEHVVATPTLPEPVNPPGPTLAAMTGRRLVLYVEDNLANVAFMREF